MPTATLTSKGQTTIPKEIRTQLDLKPGDVLDFIIQKNGQVLIQPATYSILDLKGLLQRKTQQSVSIEEMNTQIKQRARGIL